MAAFFSKKRESNDSNSITDLDNILGHIDELITHRIPLTLFSGKTAIRINAVSIEEKDKQIKVNSMEEPGLSSGSHVRIGFPLDGTWLEFESVYTHKNNAYFLSYPTDIRPNERRRENRTVLSPREEATAALLESFGKGMGIQGSLDTISSKAFTVKVQRAMDIGAERDIRFHENAVKPGQEFMLCRLKGIPGVPMIETSANVIRTSRKGGWILVMAFKNLSSDLINALNLFTSNRSMPYQVTNRSYERKKSLREELASQEKAPPPAENPQPPVAQSQTPTAHAAPPQKDPDQNKPVEESPTPDKIELPIKLIRRLQDGPTILTLGDTLKRELSFLYDLGNQWKPCQSIKEMIKALQNIKSAILIVPKTLQDQPILEYMEKLASTGAMEKITLLLFAESGLSNEEVTLCKRARVKRVFPLPLTEIEPFLSALLSAQLSD